MIVGVTVGLGPGVLAVIKAVTATLLGITVIAVNADDVSAVILILVRDFQDIPGICFRCGIGEAIAVIR